MSNNNNNNNGNPFKDMKDLTVDDILEQDAHGNTILHILAVQEPSHDITESIHILMNTLRGVAHSKYNKANHDGDTPCGLARNKRIQCLLSCSTCKRGGARTRRKHARSRRR
jgi:hypothetical protein